MNTVPHNQPVPAPEPIQLEEDLSTLLDQQSARLARRRRGANWVIFAFFGLMAASASGWYVSSEKNQRIVADLIVDFKSSGKDFKMITSATGMASQYDDALKQIGSRGGDIDAATKSLGVDPSTVAEDGMEAEMKEMMGGKGVTVGERNRMLQNGMLGRMAKARVQSEQKKVAETKDGVAPAAAPVAAIKAPGHANTPVAAQRRVAPAPAVASAARQTARVVPAPPKEIPVPDDAPLEIP